MESFQYQLQNDDISTESSSRITVVNFQPNNYIQYDKQIHPNMVSDETKIWQQPWPKLIGITQITLGVITSLIGIAEVVVIPLKEFGDGAIYFGKLNCYGIGIIAGLLLVITGSTAIRASISQRLTTVSRFLNLTILTLILYAFFTVLLIVGYNLKWTTKSSYPEKSSMYGTHIFLTVSCILGLLFTLAAFIQYANQIFFGELQLFQRWMHMFCPCCLQLLDKNFKYFDLKLNQEDANDPELKHL
ncbi:uncharacterized protein LOC106876671 [Octopus bimaculoides]|uniref:MARVEL domain-containing protein n=1 Tax=Octopus bimaculoides TaxID=37653 RepID=A0A0L8GIK8_OCTBM|nr:uncharacterized protein LOC106876671 [Octopus bimaculoides]|eukprot:XP_014780791.1 PREDICTED: uncharacterized protein LOC106876671 [Octopus bimaculoides]